MLGPRDGSSASSTCEKKLVQFDSKRKTIVCNPSSAPELSRVTLSTPFCVLPEPHPCYTSAMSHRLPGTVKKYHRTHLTSMAKYISSAGSFSCTLGDTCLFVFGHWFTFSESREITGFITYFSTRDTRETLKGSAHSQESL